MWRWRGPLMNEPALVLMDEPTGNLDASTAEPLHREIERLSDTMDQTFVIVTHNASLAAIADRVLKLERGTLHGVDTPADASVTATSISDDSDGNGNASSDPSGQPFPSRPDGSSER